MLKLQRRFQPPGGRQLPPQQAGKVVKGGGTPGEPSVPNGFVGEKGEMHHLIQKSGGTSSSSSGGLNLKRFPGQQSQHPQPQQKVKLLVNQSQLTSSTTTSPQKNRKPFHPSSDHLSASKLQARGVVPLTTKPPTSCDDVAPDSSGKVEVETAGMMCPPDESNSGAEHSGPPPAVNNHNNNKKQSSSESLPNSSSSAGGGGVQWQKHT